MAEIGKRIRSRREELGMTQKALAEKVGYKDKSAVTRIESGENDITQTKIIKFADALDTSVAYLMGWKEDESPSKGVEIPVRGRVAAGVPIEAVDEILDTEEIDKTMASTGEFFALRLRGDSMEPRMCDGDVVIVRKQETADDGDIVIASVNGTEATCKRLKIYSDGIALISFNSKYDPMFYSATEIEELPVKIWGKVVELRGKF